VWDLWASQIVSSIYPIALSRFGICWRPLLRHLPRATVRYDMGNGAECWGAKVPRGIKKRFWIFLQTTLALSLASVPVYADTSVPINAENLTKLLRGITEVGIMVDHLDEDTRTCGITEDLVKSTTELTLKKNIPVTITDVFHSNADVYVRITTNYIEQVDVCLSSVEMEVKKLVSLKDGNKTVTGLVTIWSAGNLSSGNRPDYPSWFQENLSKGLTQLSSDWLLQNR
jgi:hypothetical protein